MMHRRDLLRRTGLAAAALGLSQFPLSWAGAADTKKRNVLMFTKSEGFQHSVVTRKGTELSLAEKIVTELGKKLNFDVKCEKDGRVFVNDDLSKYDAFFFETQGDLSKDGGRDGTPGVPPEGKAKLLKAIADGKGFIGTHCASDTYHSPGARDQNTEKDKIDPYIKMIGGEFIRHGAQQKAWMRVMDNKFPGTKDLKDFELNEEWYALKNFAEDMHVILVQDTMGMKGLDYERPSFPATWARKHEKGRVFFSSMGHREDVWENKIFQDLLAGAFGWVFGDVEADITPNLKKVTPKADELPVKK